MVSISRKKSRRSTRGRRKADDAPPDLSSMDGVARKNVAQLTGDERRVSEAWFTAYIDGLGVAAIAVEAAIPRAPAGEQPELIAQKDDLVARSSDAMQQQNAFFQSRTIDLRPPTQKVIDETMRLSKAIVDRIAAERRAQAIVRLVSDLSGIFARLKS